MDQEKIGKFISKMRKNKGMTQAQLAECLNVTSQAVSKWENGRGIPDIETLKRLSEVFEINVDDILNGELKSERKIKNKKFIFIIMIILIIIFGSLSIYYLTKKNDDNFLFASLATDNDAFTIKGVMAYNKNKKSIYISEVTYDATDESKYQSIECLLYEKSDNVEKLISTSGKLASENELKTLTELLKKIEFNVDDYECGCETSTCNNLYIRINALNNEEKIITYNVPIGIEATCN